MSRYLARIGALGVLVALRWNDARPLDRRQRVVCRTPKGIELAEVLVELEDASSSAGVILRVASPEDDLLARRLNRYRVAAVRACQTELIEQNLAAILLDVDLTLDGRTLHFFFLGPTDAAVDRITGALAERFDAVAKIQDFAERLVSGCGPGCGTETQSRCGSSSGCASCQRAAACQKPATVERA